MRFGAIMISYPICIVVNVHVEIIFRLFYISDKLSSAPVESLGLRVEALSSIPADCSAPYAISPSERSFISGNLPAVKTDAGLSMAECTGKNTTSSAGHDTRTNIKNVSLPLLYK